MRENGAQRERKDKTTARRRVKSVTSGENLRETDDLTIPDYVMRDFGPSEGPHDDPDTRRHVPEVPDVNEELTPDCE